jgi:two-component system response regulator NreC
MGHGCHDCGCPNGCECPKDESAKTVSYGDLTPREIQVMKMLAIGDTNRAIANALSINIKTVDTHRQHIMKKLKCANNVKLALHALRMGWVNL